MENEVHQYKNKMEEYKEHSRNQRDKSRRIVVACMTKLEEKESDIEKVKIVILVLLIFYLGIYPESLARKFCFVVPFFMMMNKIKNPQFNFSTQNYFSSIYIVPSRT